MRRKIIEIRVSREIVLGLSEWTFSAFLTLCKLRTVLFSFLFFSKILFDRKREHK